MTRLEIRLTCGKTKKTVNLLNRELTIVEFYILFRVSPLTMCIVKRIV